jgi:hypothetical protein
MELFSIAWSRGHTEHVGPRVEQILARIIGTPKTLSARSVTGRLKRRYMSRFSEHSTGQVSDSHTVVHKIF